LPSPPPSANNEHGEYPSSHGQRRIAKCSVAFVKRNVISFSLKFFVAPDETTRLGRGEKSRSRNFIVVATKDPEQKIKKSSRALASFFVGKSCCGLDSKKKKRRKEEEKKFC